MFFIHLFNIAQPFIVDGESSSPNFHTGHYLIIDELSYRFHEPKRGDIMVFKYPLDPKKDFVKRLVGLPGERIEIRGGVAIVNGRPLTEAPFSNITYYNVDRDDWKYGRTGQVFEVPAHYYFVLGDNSANSSDGRYWGFVPQRNVLGRAKLVWWPPRRVKVLR